MAQYTPEMLASVRHAYEDTNQSGRSIAAEYEINPRTLARLIAREGWRKRPAPPPRDRPAPARLLEEAKALAAQVTEAKPLIRHPEVRAQRASKGDGPDDSPEHGPHPSRLGAARLAPQDDGDGLATAEEQLGPRLRGDDSSETPPSPIDRLEALLVKEIEAEETAQARRGKAARMPTGAKRSTRRLTELTQTLHILQRVRAGKTAEAGALDYDDIPLDIDAFRFDLARRIDAFVASRTKPADAGGNPGAQPVDDVQ